MPRVVVASFNVHGGVDGWGRPFDVVDACRRVDAEVLMLQECWSPDGGESMAERVAGQLGYVAVELAFARGRIVTPADHPTDRWGPPLFSRNVHGLRLDRRRLLANDERARARAPRARLERGTWTIAVLSKMPVKSWQT